MGSGRTGHQASGGFGASDDTYGSSTGGRSGLGGDSTGRGGFGTEDVSRRGDDLSSSGRTGGGDFGSSRTGGGLGMDFPITPLLTRSF